MWVARTQGAWLAQASKKTEQRSGEQEVALRPDLIPTVLAMVYETTSP
jgi:hypothetical protein